MIFVSKSAKRGFSRAFDLRSSKRDFHRVYSSRDGVERYYTSNMIERSMIYNNSIYNSWRKVGDALKRVCEQQG